MRKINRTSIFGQAVAKIFGRETRDLEADNKDLVEKRAEKNVQALIACAPKNRDLSKDRFIHRTIGRVPIFTMKRRKVVQVLSA